MKKVNSFIILITCVLLMSACAARRSQCPTFMEMSEYTGVSKNKSSTRSVHESVNKSADQLRDESKQLLENELRYISVKRNKKTGLVVASKRVGYNKNKKNNTLTDKGFKYNKGSYSLLGVEDEDRDDPKGNEKKK
ncbi:MAG: hypothetical protein EAZ55_12880 [Cytophagales bacterium]|nr:MAG: hypothetical protein EAZ55_12880 [Cytophagales bacterium]